MKCPPGSKAQLHTHSADLEIVVISERFFGDSSDAEKSFGPGSFIFIPAGMPHVLLALARVRRARRARTDG